ncbi:MAG: 2'-5' RNA ligase family protein [Cyclobacteriaceae bacterium]|nr:2'-5' RNA ligase family protein [Cyclobacteriaceae bacterium]
MSPIKDRYFIAIVPPSPYYEQAAVIKNYVSDKFNSKGSLLSPPHITLHMPFEWRSDREDDLITHLQNFFSLQKQTYVTFQNFNCFEPRVIFIQIEKTEELSHLQRALRQFCKKDLGLFNADYKDLPFHPHLTVAFRDLRKPMFKSAWEEFSKKKFEGTFLVNNISLLKHINGKWDVMKEFSLSKT